MYTLKDFERWQAKAREIAGRTALVEEETTPPPKALERLDKLDRTLDALKAEITKARGPAKQHDHSKLPHLSTWKQHEKTAFIAEHGYQAYKSIIDRDLGR